MEVNYRHFLIVLPRCQQFSTIRDTLWYTWGTHDVTSKKKPPQLFYPCRGVSGQKDLLVFLQTMRSTTSQLQAVFLSTITSPILVYHITSSHNPLISVTICHFPISPSPFIVSWRRSKLGKLKQLGRCWNF